MLEIYHTSSLLIDAEQNDFVTIESMSREGEDNPFLRRTIVDNDDGGNGFLNTPAETTHGEGNPFLRPASGQSSEENEYLDTAYEIVPRAVDYAMATENRVTPSRENVFFGETGLRLAISYDDADRPKAITADFTPEGYAKNTPEHSFYILKQLFTALIEVRNYFQHKFEGLDDIPDIVNDTNPEFIELLKTLGERYQLDDLIVVTDHAATIKLKAFLALPEDHRLLQFARKMRTRGVQAQSSF